MVTYGQNLVTTYFYFLDDTDNRLKCVLDNVDHISLCFTLLS